LNRGRTREIGEKVGVCYRQQTNGVKGSRRRIRAKRAFVVRKNDWATRGKSKNNKPDGIKASEKTSTPLKKKVEGGGNIGR